MVNLPDYDGGREGEGEEGEANTCRLGSLTASHDDGATTKIIAGLSEEPIDVLDTSASLCR